MLKNPIDQAKTKDTGAPAESGWDCAGYNVRFALPGTAATSRLMAQTRAMERFSTSSREDSLPHPVLLVLADLLVNGRTRHLATDAG